MYDCIMGQKKRVYNNIVYIKRYKTYGKKIQLKNKYYLRVYKNSL